MSIEPPPARQESSPYKTDRMIGLPVGTRVQKRGTGRRTRAGVVMPHEPEYSRGSFPVRFDDGIWEVLDATFVIVLAPPKGSDL